MNRVAFDCSKCSKLEQLQLPGVARLFSSTVACTGCRSVTHQSKDIKVKDESVRRQRSAQTAWLGGGHIHVLKEAMGLKVWSPVHVTCGSFQVETRQDEMESISKMCHVRSRKPQQTC